jgi:hypothetical protein
MNINFNLFKIKDVHFVMVKKKDQEEQKIYLIYDMYNESINKEKSCNFVFKYF